MLRRVVAVGGRRDCRLVGQSRGIEDWKSENVGRTARQGARMVEVSRARSAARRPWTVMGSRGREMDFGTVKAVRREDRGTLRIVVLGCRELE